MKAHDVIRTALKETGDMLNMYLSDLSDADGRAGGGPRPGGTAGARGRAAAVRRYGGAGAGERGAADRPPAAALRQPTSMALARLSSETRT